jgi:hypothetical protein
MVIKYHVTYVTQCGVKLEYTLAVSSAVTAVVAKKPEIAQPTDMVAATNWSAKPAAQAFFLTTTGFPPVDRCCE